MAKIEIHNLNELIQQNYPQEIVEKMRQNLAQILSREEQIELRELCLLGFDRSSAFIALLFLEREGEYEIHQKEFYKELYTRKMIAE